MLFHAFLLHIWLPSKIQADHKKNCASTWTSSGGPLNRWRGEFRYSYWKVSAKKNTIGANAGNFRMTKASHQTQNAVRLVFSVESGWKAAWDCWFFCRELAHADDMTLKAKVRDELVKIYYQNEINTTKPCVFTI